MNAFEAVVSQLAVDLTEQDAHWAVIGGLAVGARTEPRFTRDVDVAVEAAGDRGSEALVRSLMTKGYQVLAVVEQKAAHRLATVRLVPPQTSDGIVVDLLFASSGIEPETVADAEVLELFAGVSAPVARSPHLIAMKLLSRDDQNREQDRGDLRMLLQRATLGELDKTRALVGFIVERGFNRGRDLMTALEVALQEWSPTKD